MKKYISIFIILLAVLIVSLMSAAVYFQKYLAKSKSVTSITEIEEHIENPDILIPAYHLNDDNPYLYVAGEEMYLERSRQYGEWDGYHIIIRPAKLSSSACFEIIISCSSTDDNETGDIEWAKKDVTADYIHSDNYPEGDYTRYTGTFWMNSNVYELTGYAFGPIDENRDLQIVEELMFIKDTLK